MRNLFTSCLMMGCVLLSSFIARGQDITISGKVTDAAGAPLPGVSVILKGTTRGTQTNENGNYTIQAPGNGTLSFSYITYTSQEIPINGQAIVNVSLKAEASQLEEVVVVGYGSQRKLDVTGSVSVVKGEDISKQASSNALSGLQGKVAGVQITNSGSPGSSPQVRIRGVGTVYGSTNPLYVVDGVWLDDISFLNPGDIESMSILKDASSEGIYGVRAANGVVLITTKRGKGKASITYDGAVGFQKVTNNVPLMNGTEYATLINEKRDIINERTGSNPDLLDDPSTFGQGTDWMGRILRSAFQTSHNVNISGSGEKSSYGFALGYLKQQGIVKDNDYERITGRLTADFTPAEFIKLGYNAILQYGNTNDIPADLIYKAYTAAPIVPEFNPDGTYGDPSLYHIGDVTNNPSAELNFFNQKSKNYKVTGNVFADINILKNLKFRTSFGGEFGQDEMRGYIPVYRVGNQQHNDISKLTIQKEQTRNWIWENTLTYDAQLGDNKFTLLAGQSAQRYNYYTITGTAQNVPYSSEGDLYLALGPNTTANPRTVVDNGSLSTTVSYFGRVNYSFKDRYLLNASLRWDGSSKFIDDQRWGVFPTIGAGWVLSEENFMADQTFFDILKIKGSWGKVGNSSVPANLSILTVDQNGNLTAVFGDQPYPGASIDQGVPPVTYWERGVGTDVGIEAAMLNNRLTFEADWYEKKTENGIFALPVLGSIGYKSGEIVGNQADFRNRGLEFMVGWNEKKENGFSYNLNANFTVNSNEVTRTNSGQNPIFKGGLAATSGLTSTRTVVGRPIGEFYGMDVVGIFQNQAEIDQYVNADGDKMQPSAVPGDFKYADVNGDGKINTSDRVPLGNPNPKYTYGLSASFSYKNFDIGIDFQGVGDVQVYNANKGLKYGDENSTKDIYDHRWHGEGTSNTYPSADVVGGTNVSPNTWYVESGSYVRIRNLQIGYTLPAGILSNWKLQRLRVFIDAQNPLSIFKYTGFSPEVVTPSTSTTVGTNTGGNPLESGIDNGVYPLSATYRFGVNVSF